MENIKLEEGTGSPRTRGARRGVGGKEKLPETEEEPFEAKRKSKTLREKEKKEFDVERKKEEDGRASEPQKRQARPHLRSQMRRK